MPGSAAADDSEHGHQASGLNPQQHVADRQSASRLVCDAREGSRLTLCAQCGLENSAGLCVHHVMKDSPEAHITARIWCDFIHRCKPPPAMPTERLTMTRETFLVLFVDAGGDDLTARLVWREILDEDDGPLTPARVAEMAHQGKYIGRWDGGGYD